MVNTTALVELESPESLTGSSNSPTLATQARKIYNANITLNNISVKSRVFASKTPFHSPLVGMGRAIISAGKSLELEDFYRIKNINTTIKAGEMVLVVAAPGDGSSTFLKAISNRIAITEGSISLNGTNVKDLSKPTNLTKAPNQANKTPKSSTPTPIFNHPIDFNKVVVYTDQSDVHLPFLTVRETLEFASSITNPYHNDPTNSHNHSSVDKIISLMGLSEAADTLVGSETVKGISGGQKRRLTLAEMLVSGSAVICADSYSDGLDSSTTAEITKQLKQWANSYGTSVIATLKQPPPEVFEMYDHIIVLKEGQVVYDGPNGTELEGYFAKMGFKDSNMELADLIIEVLTQPRSTGLKSLLQSNCDDFGDDKGGDVGEKSIIDENTMMKTTDRICISTESMLDFYYSSPQYAKVVETIKVCLPNAVFEHQPTIITDNDNNNHNEKMTNPHDPVHEPSGSLQPQTVPITTDLNRFGMGYSNGYGPMVKSLARRYRIVTVRNKPIFFARLLNAFFMALLFGSLYWQIPDDKVTSRVGQLLLSTLQLSFSQMINIPTGLSFTAVAHKQMSGRFYNAPVFVLMNFLLSLPFSLLETIIYIGVVYFMTGAAIGAMQIILSAIIIFLASAYLSAWFQMSTVTQNEILSQALSLPITGFFMSLGGIFLFRSAMPRWIAYTIYHTPFSFIIRALMNIQFSHAKFDVLVQNPSSPGSLIRLGDLYLSQADMWIGMEWVGYAVLYLVGFMGVTMLIHMFFLHSPYHESRTGTDRSSASDEMIEQRLIDAAVEMDRKAAAAGDVKLVNNINSIILLTKNITDTGVATNINSNIANNSNNLNSTIKNDTQSNDNVTINMNKVSPLALLQVHIPMEPVWLTFQDLSYRVQVSSETSTTERTLLNNISGIAQPGMMLALMGASGAGKTTLLNLLSLKANGGVIEGIININNQPLTPRLLSQYIGFVEQFDTLYGYDTVFETILFAARLRLPSTLADHIKIDITNEILSVLNLHNLHDYQITNLSFAQRKLVSIGVQLVSSPSVLFLDEPTTGLDSKSAAELIKIIRLLAQCGMTIICTIHQPNTSIFLSFDDLLLLAPGGHVQYNGPIGHMGLELANYFKNASSKVGAIQPKMNPAVWMLDELSKFDGEEHIQLSQQFKSSQKFKAIQKKTQDVHKTAIEDNNQKKIVSGEGKIEVPQSFAKLGTTQSKPSLAVQFYYLFLRNSHGYVRCPFYIFARLTMVIMLSICFGLLYQGIKMTDMISTASLLSGVFIPAFFAGLLHAATTSSYHFALRTTFYREIEDGYYKSFLWYPTNLILEIISVVIAAILTQQPMYFIIGLPIEGSTWAQYLLVLFMLILTFVTTAMMLQSVVPTLTFSQLFLGVYFCLGFIFSGLALPFSTIPRPYRWLYRGLTLGYSLEAMVDVLFARLDNVITVLDPTTHTPMEIPVNEFIASYLRIEYGHYWMSLMWVLVYNIAMVIIAGIATTFLKFIKK